MAAFSTLAAAEIRAKAKQSGTGDGTWVVAHAERTIAGTIAVRVQRKMAPGAGAANGAWVDITDDNTT